MELVKGLQSYWKDGVMGVIVGDALGLPVQFVSREELKEKPVTAMMGYGTFKMPKGSWSDDGSMTLATLDSIREKNGIDYDDIMKRFVEWDRCGAYTPLGFAYDQGNTCSYAITAYKKDSDYRTCGRTGEWNNGNGSLMRILPACLYAYEQRKEGNISLDQVMEMVHTVCALTHNTHRAKIGCGIYYFLVEAILEDKNSEEKQPLIEVLQSGIDKAKEYYEMDLLIWAELARYGRLFNLSDFANTPEEDIKSSGYVVDSLEAAVWSFITTSSFKECLLKAVNLGDDTDTVGAVVGGLAGLYYGCEGMPKEWLEAVWKTDELIDILDNMK